MYTPQAKESKFSLFLACEIGSKRNGNKYTKMSFRKYRFMPPNLEYPVVGYASPI